MLKRLIQLQIIKNKHEFYCHKIWIFSASKKGQYSWWHEHANEYKQKYDELRFWFQKPLRNKYL